LHLIVSLALTLAGFAIARGFVRGWT